MDMLDGASAFNSRTHRRDRVEIDSCLIGELTLTASGDLSSWPYERRSYSERLDATRACIIRSCMRSVEIELCREARENDRPAK